MANESTYTTATELIDTEYISRSVLQSLREDAGLALSLATVVDIGPMATRAVAFPANNSYSATTKSVDSTQTSNTAYNPTDAVATAAEYSAMSTITDMLARSSVVDVSAQIAGEIRAVLSEQILADYCALLDTFTGGSQNVGSTGVNITALVMLEALKNLKANAKNAASQMPAFVLHPQQVFDLQGEGFTATANQGNAFAREDILRIYGSGGLQQFVGEFSGVPLFSVAQVVTANSAADRAGALVCAGHIGCAMKWMPEIEAQRAVVNGYNATTVLGTVAFGFVETSDLRGVSIITDA